MLEGFVTGLTELLEDNLVGAYLHGSLALGAFDPRQSDVDFLVATERVLTGDEVDRLGALHARLGERLDGSYLPRDVFRRFDSRRRMHPHVESRGGHLFVDHHGGETIIYRHVLRESGVVLAGPEPGELIDPVSDADLRWGVCDILENWWKPMLVRPAEAFRDALYRAYAVVTMCRVRYTLETGAVVSKPAAAEWAVGHLEPGWRDLIARAAARGDCGYDETVAFVRATLDDASC